MGQHHCRYCGQAGHDARTCPTAPWTAVRREWERQQSPRAATKRRTLEWVRLTVEDGWNLAQIADKYGVTRQAVSLALYRAGVSRRELERKQNEARRAERRLERCLALMQEAIDNDWHCTICGAWVIRPYRNPIVKIRTCSPECGKALRGPARFRVSDEAYEARRRSQAKSILRHPEKYAASAADWAERMLSDNPPPPNRRYSWPTSKASQAFEELRKRA